MRKKHKEYHDTACMLNLEVTFQSFSKDKTQCQYACQRCGVKTTFSGSKRKPCTRRTTAISPTTFRCWTLGRKATMDRHKRSLAWSAKHRLRKPPPSRRARKGLPPSTKEELDDRSRRNVQKSIDKVIEAHRRWATNMQRQPRLRDTMCHSDLSQPKVRSTTHQGGSKKNTYYACRRCNKERRLSEIRNRLCVKSRTSMSSKQFEKASVRCYNTAS